MRQNPALVDNFEALMRSIPAMDGKMDRLEPEPNDNVTLTKFLR
jgi:hypothetical protein